MHRSTPATDVPRFFLYKDEELTRDAAFFHIEDIRSRSERYDWEIASHAHPGLYQLVLLLAGRAEVVLDGVTEHLPAPGAVSLPPGVVHAFRFHPGSHGYVLTLAEGRLLAAERQAGAWLGQVLFARAGLLRFVAGETAIEQLGQLLVQIHDEFRHREPGQAPMLEWLANAVLLRVARQQQAHATAANPVAQAQSALFGRLRSLIEAHYLEHWPINRYAEALHSTASNLNRLCREVADCPPSALIQERLLLEARRRLLYTAAPVSRLAYELGFQDPAYFCRFFRRRTGMTPGDFRRRRAIGTVTDGASSPELLRPVERD